MNLTRWLMFAALGMLSSTWVRADIITGQTFTITLTAWDPDQTFEFTPTTGLDTGDFTNPDDFCPSFDACFDPGMKLEKTGDATDENGPFPFSTGATGTTALSFTNTGSDITELVIPLTSNGGELNSDQDFSVFTCDGGDLFTNCGFLNDGFEVAYWDTPEPSQWMVVAIAFAALIAVRARRKYASSSSAQIQ